MSRSAASQCPVCGPITFRQCLRVDAAISRKSPDPLLKPHHLELFYYVAKYGGISAASRSIPYGLGQPAISGQISALERQLGTSLFERKPFQLTEPGRKLYVRVKAMFEDLDLLEAELTGRPGQPMRIATDDGIGLELLPAVMTAAATLPRGIAWELRTVPPGSLEMMLRERRVHLGITTADGRTRGVRSRVLARLGLRLLVRRQSRIFSPGHFWRQKTIAEPLICPVESDAVKRSFERGLQALCVKWQAGIQVDSNAMMMKLVANGHGVGLGLELPSQVRHTSVRALPLTGFDPVQLVALWSTPARPWVSSLLAVIGDTARNLWPEKE